MVIDSEIQIPFSELEISYVRSSGPGGQNVNKVNSKAVLRWSVISSVSLTPEKRAIILRRLGARVTVDGDIVVTSDRFRDQSRNREDCIEKLRNLLVKACSIPKPRKATQPSYSSQKRARERKNRHSRKKSLRRGPRADD